MAGLKLGTELPNITAQSQVGSIHLHDLIGDAWLMLFSVSADFDPAATTVTSTSWQLPAGWLVPIVTERPSQELGMVAKLQSEFEARNCKVVAVAMETGARYACWLES